MLSAISTRAPWASTAFAVAAGGAVLTTIALSTDSYLRIVAVLVVLAMGLIGLTLQLGKPLLGVSVLVATGVAFPYQFRGPAGVMMNSPFPLAGLLCSIWLLRELFVRRSTIESSRVVYSIVAFMAVTLLSFGMGQFPWYPTGAPLPAQLAGLGLMLLSGLLFLAVAHQIESIEQLKVLTWLLVGLGVITCLFQMFPVAAGVARLTTRPGSVGSLFWTWLLAVSLSQAIFNRSLSPVFRLCLFAVTGLVLFHGLIQVRSWASGWLPPLIALGVIGFMRMPRLTIGVSLVAVPAAMLFSSALSTALLGDESYSLATRQGAWATLWELVQRSPLLGTGPSNYYYYTENLNIMGWYVRFISHNNYQDLLVETGFLGLLAFCWFACEALLMTLQLYKRIPSGGFAKAYIVGALGGAAGSLMSGMLGDWIIPFYYNAGILGFRSSLLFWVFLGGVLALKRIVSSSVEAPAVARREPAPIRRHHRQPVQAL